MAYNRFMDILIKTTQVYEKEIDKLLSLAEREQMEKEIAHDPLYWPVIRGTGGVRKARFACDNLGKRGGGRVCYFYLQIYQTIYMLKAYKKNQQENLTEKEKKQIYQIVKQIKQFVGER